MAEGRPLIETGPQRRHSVSDYLPLSDLSHAREFRLIKIHPDNSNTLSCEIRRYKIHNAPPFRALSYTWKDPLNTKQLGDSPTEDILVDGKLATVGKNLARGLKAIRDWHSSNEEFLWTDAICIDQENARERAYQVSIMGDIFSRADSVFVWLGDEAQGSDMALNFVKLLTKLYRDRDLGRAKTLALARDVAFQKHWQALESLWIRRWWSRAWVLQETILARHVEFCCGRMVVQQSDIFEAATIMREVLDELYTILETQHGIRLSMPTFHAIDGMQRILNARLQGTIFPLITCHYRTMSPQATDVRDFLFAKMGMASDGSIVRPSYTDPVDQVYTDFVLEHIKHTKSLDIIHFDARPRKVLHIPSWVPDWSAGFAADPLNPDHGGNPALNFPYYTASLDEPASPIVERGPSEGKVLGCQGYAFDVIDGLAHSEEHSWAGEDIQRPVKQPRSKKCAYTNRTQIFEGLWKALTINQELSGDVANGKNGPLLAASFRIAYKRLHAGEQTDGSTPRLRFERMCEFLREFKVFGETVEDRMVQAAAEWPASYIPTATSTRIETTMMEWYTFRRLLTTQGGYVGVGPPEAEPGDVVAILFGRSVPVLLRPAESGTYTVLGETYIHGIMYGEGLKELRRNGLEPTIFRLA